MIERDPVFVNKTEFRFLFGLSEQETDEMTAQKYMDYMIMKVHCLKLMHAPYLKHE